MRDRIPTPGKENRVKITMDDGSVLEGVLSYADEATQEGSAYTKENVLPDEVCDLMALNHDASEPDDAFRYLALMQASVYGKIVVTVTSNGLPLMGINFTIGSNLVTTNSQGQASIIISPGSYTATFSNTLDLIFSQTSMQMTAEKGKINYYNVTATESTTTQATFTSSTNISFSDRVSDFDIFCVGGGGSGGAACGLVGSSGYSLTLAATGGAGGYTATALNVPNTGELITVVVGAGGSSAVASRSRTGSFTASGETDGSNDGGETYVSIAGEKKCSALGGNGGSGSYEFKGAAIYLDGKDGGSGSGGVSTFYNDLGTGAGGSDGADGGTINSSATGGKGQGTTTKAFGEEDGIAYSPAGASISSSRTGSAGTNGGSANQYFTSGTSANANASAGSVAGAGGGGCIAGVTNGNGGTLSANAYSGAGKDGIVIIRWRYAS